MWSRLYIIYFLGQAVASPAFTNRRIQTRELAGARVAGDDSEANIFDASDLSWINKLAAIGDSYSAGIGAGDRLGGITEALDPQSDWSCSRYDHSYPYLINTDERLGDPAKRKFQFKSCSGAVTKDVLEKQIPSIDSGQQAILLSIGGNDVQLVNILNQCIYQWSVLNQEQVAVAKLAALDKKYEWAAGFDWDTLGRGCEGQLDHTQSLIDSGTFSSNLDAVLNAAKAKLIQGGMIYFTGYGKFFGEKLSPECNDVSWTTWIYKAFNLFQPAAKLTVDRRKRMNELVDAVNAKLKAAAERAGPSVKFVNYDSYIGEFGGRYCEPGVDESTTESNSRPRLMFYELNTLDPLGKTPWKRSNGDPLDGTFAGSLDIFAEITLLVDPDAKLTHQDKVKEESTAKQVFDGFSNKELGNIQIPNLLPDGYGRVFHPQILLHEIIANLVIYDMANDNEKRNGHPEIPEVLSINSCPFSEPLPSLPPTTTTPPTTIPIETPNGSSCATTATKEVCTIPREPCATSLSCESWVPTQTAPSMGQVTCFPEERRPIDIYGPVNPDNYAHAAADACKAFSKKGNKHPKPEDWNWTWVFTTRDGNTPYWFHIGWQPDCRLPGDGTKQEQNMGNPLGDGSHNCETIFKDDIFHACNNGGRGGFIKAGCLIYAFEPCDDRNSGGCFTIGQGAPWVAVPK